MTSRRPHTKRFQCVTCGAYTNAVSSTAAAAQLRASCSRQDPAHRPLVHVDGSSDPFQDQADLDRFFPAKELTT